MAIAIDTTTKSGAWNGSESSVTWSHTCTGSNLVLVAWTTCFTGTTTSMTYNGVSMTAVATDGASPLVSSYILKAPATGANNVVANFSATTYVRTQAISFTGANQTTQPNASDGTQTDATSPYSVSLTVTGTAWICGGYYCNEVPTATAGTTKYQDANELTLFAKTAATTDTSGSLDWTGSPDKNQHGVLIGVAELSAASGPANLKTLDTNLKANIKSYNTNLLANIKSINTNA